MDVINALRCLGGQLAFDNRAVTAIEYALIAALVAVVIIGGITHIGTGITGTFNKVASEL